MLLLSPATVVTLDKVINNNSSNNNNNKMLILIPNAQYCTMWCGWRMAQFVVSQVVVVSLVNISLLQILIIFYAPLWLLAYLKAFCILLYKVVKTGGKRVRGFPLKVFLEPPQPPILPIKHVITRKDAFCCTKWDFPWKFFLSPPNPPFCLSNTW